MGAAMYARMEDVRLNSTTQYLLGYPSMYHRVASDLRSAASRRRLSFVVCIAFRLQ